MKELLDKFLGLFSEGVAKMEESNTEEAIKKFKEASDMSESLQKKAGETHDEVDLKKFFESEDGKETLKKYVDMYLSASDTKTLMDELKTLTDKVTDLVKQKNEDDETISSTLDKTIDRIEELEKTLEKKRVSKID